MSTPLLHKAAKAALKLKPPTRPRNVKWAPVTTQFKAGHHFQQSTLANGLRVATERMEGGPPTATVGVWIDTGSRYENDANNGVAHFLEHLFFKGTSRRTRTSLEQEVENMGGHLNAYTSREQTVFYAKVFKDDVGQAMDILSDILTNSKLEQSAIERERQVILAEMQEVESQMEEVIFDRLHQTAFRGTPLGKTILGPVENIQSLTQAQIKTYLASHYTAPRMVVAAAGDIDHAEVHSLSEKMFGGVPSTPPNGIEPVMSPARFMGSDIRHREDSMPHVHVAYGFETAGWTDPDNFDLMVIQTMLGQYDRSTTGAVHSTSPLLASIAGEDIAESFTAFNTQYSDTGLFGVYTVSDPKSTMMLYEVVTEAITGLCYHPDEDLVEEAKKRLAITMLGQLDGSTVVCEDVGRQILTYGRRMPIEEVLARINLVDAQTVKACANRYFYDRDFALASVGNSHELQDYNVLRRKTYFMTY